MSNKTKGFTLIELLVVIAIIGILSSVVLASLNTARTKGSDAAVKASMANARAQAELFYDGPGQTYDLVCSAASGVGAILNGAVANSKDISVPPDITNVDTTAASIDIAVCHDSLGAWAAQIPLKGGNTWCVDSAGTSASRTGFLAPSAYVCPAS